jgi:hypothetical protein
VVAFAAPRNPPIAHGKGDASGGGARGHGLDLAFLAERLADEPAELVARVLALLEHRRLALVQQARSLPVSSRPVSTTTGSYDCLVGCRGQASQSASTLAKLCAASAP